MYKNSTWYRNNRYIYIYTQYTYNIHVIYVNQTWINSVPYQRDESTWVSRWVNTYQSSRVFQQAVPTGLIPKDHPEGRITWDAFKQYYEDAWASWAPSPVVKNSWCAPTCNNFIFDNLTRNCQSNFWLIQCSFLRLWGFFGSGRWWTLCGTCEEVLETLMTLPEGEEPTNIHAELSSKEYLLTWRLEVLNLEKYSK